jgi:hypothetical protein
LFPSAKNGLPNEASGAVKNKTALKYPSGYTIVPLGIFAIFLFIDAMTIREELTRRGFMKGRGNG